MELKETGLDIGERRVGRLMRINGVKPVRTRKHKVTTDSHHRLGVAASWLGATSREWRIKRCRQACLISWPIVVG